MITVIKNKNNIKYAKLSFPCLVKNEFEQIALFFYEDEGVVLYKGKGEQEVGEDLFDIDGYTPLGPDESIIISNKY